MHELLGPLPPSEGREIQGSLHDCVVPVDLRGNRLFLLSLLPNLHSWWAALLGLVSTVWSRNRDRRSFCHRWSETDLGPCVSLPVRFIDRGLCDGPVYGVVLLPPRWDCHYHGMCLLSALLSVDMYSICSSSAIDSPGAVFAVDHHPCGNWTASSRSSAHANDSCFSSWIVLCFFHTSFCVM